MREHYGNDKAKYVNKMKLISHPVFPVLISFTKILSEFKKTKERLEKEVTKNQDKKYMSSSIIRYQEFITEELGEYLFPYS